MARAKKAPVTPIANSNVPEGFKPLGGSYAPTWAPENPGDTLQGATSSVVKEVERTIRKEQVTLQVVEITTDDGERFSLWDSATLQPLFEELVNRGPDGIGTQVYICFDGIGKKKPGQQPPKLFTVAIAE